MSKGAQYPHRFASHELVSLFSSNNLLGVALFDAGTVGSELYLEVIENFPV